MISRPARPARLARRVLGGLAGALLALSPALAPVHAGGTRTVTVTVPPAATGHAAGPRDAIEEPPGVRAPTFDALAALVADPTGPRDIVLEGRTYVGDLVIKRPVAIHGTKGTVLEGAGSGTVVTIQANDVLVEDVVVRRSGHRHTTEDSGIKATGERIRIATARVEDTLFGVSLSACRHCQLDRVHVVGYGDDTELRGDGIKLWEAHDSSVKHCVVEHARDMVVWYTRRALLEDNAVKKSRYGTHFMYAHDATIRRSRLEGNVVGIFVMYSLRMLIEDNLLAGARGAAGVGLGFKDSDSIQIRGNWVVANTAGSYLDNTPRTPEQPVTFEGNVLALNDVALRLHSQEKGLSFRGNDFRQNAMMIEVDGGINALTASFSRNYYGDYEGYDLDRDGIGDVAYEVKALSSELTDARPALKFFRGTAAMGVVDAVSHALPLLAAQKLLVDTEPLVSVPRIPVP